MKNLMLNPAYLHNIFAKIYGGYPSQPPFFPGSGEDFFFDKAVLTIEASAIPVPSAIWLLGSGLAGLIAVRRRKK